MARKKKAAKSKAPKAAKTAKKPAARPTSLLGMVKDLGGRFEELKRRTAEGAERAREIAQEIRKNVIEPRWRALQNRRKKR